MGWRPDWTIDPSSRNYGHGPLSLPPLRRCRRLRWALARHLVQRVRAAALDVRPPPPAAGDHPRARRQPGASAPGAGLAPPPALPPPRYTRSRRVAGAGQTVRPDGNAAGASSLGVT